MCAFSVAGQCFKSFLNRSNLMIALVELCMIFTKQFNKWCSRNGAITDTLLNERAWLWLWKCAFTKCNCHLLISAVCSRAGSTSICYLRNFKMTQPAVSPWIIQCTLLFGHQLSPWVNTILIVHAGKPNKLWVLGSYYSKCIYIVVYIRSLQ